jgi:hypothetical protein
VDDLTIHIPGAVPTGPPPAPEPDEPASPFEPWDPWLCEDCGAERVQHSLGVQFQRDPVTLTVEVVPDSAELDTHCSACGENWANDELLAWLRLHYPGLLR